VIGAKDEQIAALTASLEAAVARLEAAAAEGAASLGSAVERGFWAADGMMVQVSGLRLAAERKTA
jgi:hypothetical protein